MATMKEIAELSGVSRGTVDRVLNHRGIVNAETERKVLEIAKLLHDQQGTEQQYKEQFWRIQRKSYRIRR